MAHLISGAVDSFSGLAARFSPPSSTSSDPTVPQPLAPIGIRDYLARPWDRWGDRTCRVSAEDLNDQTWNALRAVRGSGNFFPITVVCMVSGTQRLIHNSRDVEEVLIDALAHRRFDALPRKPELITVTPSAATVTEEIRRIVRENAASSSDLDRPVNITSGLAPLRPIVPAPVQIDLGEHPIASGERLIRWVGLSAEPGNTELELFSRRQRAEDARKTHQSRLNQSADSGNLTHLRREWKTQVAALRSLENREGAVRVGYTEEFVPRKHFAPLSDAIVLTANGMEVSPRLMERGKGTEKRWEVLGKGDVCIRLETEMVPREGHSRVVITFPWNPAGELTPAQVNSPALRRIAQRYGIDPSAFAWAHLRNRALNELTASATQLLCHIRHELGTSFSAGGFLGSREATPTGSYTPVRINRFPLSNSLFSPEGPPADAISEVELYRGDCSADIGGQFILQARRDETSPDEWNLFVVWMPADGIKAVPH